MTRLKSPENIGFIVVFERGENLKLKEKLKNWLFADEIKRIQILETCYKDQIDWCKDRADESDTINHHSYTEYVAKESASDKNVCTGIQATDKC